jgi:hypothetical protein
VDSAERERREFFRINDRLLLEFKEVSRQESLVLEKTLNGPDLFPGLPVSGADALPERSAFRKNELYAYFDSIDRKLDLLIELLSNKDNSFQSAYVDVSISGCGLKYCSAMKLDEGAYLELRIGLPSFPGRPIRALGRVVRVTAAKTGDREGWDTAVGFAAISEKDRDALVGHIFARERECLRMKQLP